MQDDNGQVNLTDRQGKKLTRPTNEWINKQGDDPIVKVTLYNATEKRVLEYLKNKKTGARLLLKYRRPTQAEEIEGNTKLFQKGASPVTGKDYDQLELITEQIQ